MSILTPLPLADPQGQQDKLEQWEFRIQRDRPSSGTVEFSGTVTVVKRQSVHESGQKEKCDASQVSLGF
jgi:hypothetical protein